MTVAEFLLARIAEDEAVAQDALERGFGGWEYFSDQGVNYEARTHIVRHDPARVLAECEAKRRQIDHLIRFMENDYAPWNEEQLQIMAAVFADHPDYREDWRDAPGGTGGA